MKAVDGAKLKEVVKILNAAVYEVEGEGDVAFLENKIKVVGVSVEKIAEAFVAAINGLDEDVAGVLPDDVIDFYNDIIKEDEEPKPEEKPTKAAKKEPAAKKDPATKKEPVELSVFGHKKGSQAAKLDELLAPGKYISLEDLVKQSGRSTLGVKSHIKHLCEARKLTIQEKDGTYRYVKNPTAK